eukprot:TRINITY_DN6863_c0_g1_i1.p1 TRINITY_DN6863_c0_g1~~TRINITY_DN6863_c0_g1_i1.p1  ORF type:complete len:145 (-),score=18.59 TRINITY_DN6863_c0_g1_i1:34-468(-)
MAVLGEKAKEFFKDIYSNLWAYQNDHPKNQNISLFDKQKVFSEGPPTRKFMLWRTFYPLTSAARLRTFGAKSKFALFGVALVGLYQKDAFLRAHGEGPAFARVERKGYVRLADGRLAQVCPQIDADLSIFGAFNSLLETLNPVP